MQTFRKLPMMSPKRKKAAMVTFLLWHSRRRASITQKYGGARWLTGGNRLQRVCPVYLISMNWLEQRIRRYEHRRWTTDDNRRVRPFEWGLQHIGGRVDEADPRGFLREYAEKAIGNSREWYAVEPASDYRLDSENVLTFTSSIESPWVENNTVHARLLPAKTKRAAVLVLPNWNAKWHGQLGLCQWIERMGISALKMSLPYHDRRMAKGHERADQLVGSNIGLTLQANRQAVQDAKRCLRWLEQNGYSRIGILGTSIGSSIGYIALMHDSGVHAGGF